VLKTALNVLRFSTRPDHLRVIAKKVLARFTEAGANQARDEIKAWCSARSTDYSTWARSQDEDLWREASDYAAGFEADARRTLDASRIRFGGGGAYALLYFLVRQHRPEHVVETGVAAGWSSAAILAAMERNASGHLWSSDFPYFRQADAADEIGVLVPASLRERWTLLIDGDEQNLPRIMAEVPRVDLFHYDSDKSISGRRFALATVQPKLAPDGLVIFDDIQDNSHFRDIAGSDAVVFEERGKYLGITGL
jgi:predicted O-methyltransferase YrrM